MKGQSNLFSEIDNEIYKTVIEELDICYDCQYDHNSCCTYEDTKDDYCILGNKKISVKRGYKHEKIV